MTRIRFGFLFLLSLFIASNEHLVADQFNGHDPIAEPQTVSISYPGCHEAVAVACATKRESCDNDAKNQTTTADRRDFQERTICFCITDQTLTKDDGYCTVANKPDNTIAIAPFCTVNFKVECRQEMFARGRWRKVILIGG